MADEVCIQRVPQGRRGRVTRTSNPDYVRPAPIVDNGKTRPKSLPKSRNKRRMALALRDADPHPPQHVRLRHRDGPTAIEKGEWRDPDDIRPNAAKTGRTIQGYQVPCQLAKIRRSGSREITDEHILAAEYIRVRWDVARVGFQAERDGLPVNQVVYLPRLDFSGAAHARSRAIDELKRVWETLSGQQQRMAEAIILNNFAIPYWCGSEHQRTGYRHDVKVELGKLSGMMEHLAKFLEADIDDAKQQGQMRA